MTVTTDKASGGKIYHFQALLCARHRQLKGFVFSSGKHN